jgi:hypothetical protein
MFRCLLWAIAAAMRPRVLLIADNLCLRQQLLVLQRRKPRPRLTDADRRFWILAYRWFVGWRTSLLIVKPETVLRCHRRAWRTYWRRRSSRRAKMGRQPIAPELRTLIRRMAIENRLWGQRRIQAELARVGIKVSARTIAKYMRPTHRHVMEASKHWYCDDLSSLVASMRCACPRRAGCTLSDRTMRAPVVEKADILGQDLLQMPLIEYEHMVHAVASQRYSNKVNWLGETPSSGTCGRSESS